MKKLLLLIAGALLIAATAQANCGGCGSKAEKSADKAACAIKADADKAACEMKAAKAECAVEKVACEIKEDKAECAKKGSKWNPINWFK